MSFIFEHSEIISVVLALIFGLTSIIGKTWDENINKRVKLTKLGYIMGSVFFLLLIFSVSATIHSEKQARIDEKRMKEINERTKNLLDSLQVASRQTRVILGTLGEVQKESMSLKADLAESAAVLETHVTRAVDGAKSALEAHVNGAVGESEGRVTGAVDGAKLALKGQIAGAVGESEGRVTGAVDGAKLALKGQIAGAAKALEGHVTGAVDGAKSALEAHVNGAVGESEGRVTGAVDGAKSELKEHINDSFSQKGDVEQIATEVKAIRALMDSLGNEYLPKVARFLSQRGN